MEPIKSLSHDKVMGFFHFDSAAMIHHTFLLVNAVSDVDLLDQIIYVTIILFILSVITEKFTQLVRMYPAKFRGIAIYACLAFYYPLTVALINTKIETHGLSTLLGIVAIFVANTITLAIVVANTDKLIKSKLPVHHLASLRNITKSKNASEKTKEREVTVLSFIIGLIVGYSFQINLLQVFKVPSSSADEASVSTPLHLSRLLEPAAYAIDLIALAGFLLTAFFLAFGSKFFHDLLDTLLYAKNLKRHMSDNDTFRVESADQLQAILKHTQSSMIKLAIEQNKADLQKLPNFFSVHEGIDVATGERMVFLNIKDNNLTGLPSTLKYNLEGMTRTVPVKIVPNMGVASVTAGKIYNKNTATFIGSIGVPFTLNQELWLLTCGHVMLGGDFDPVSQQGRLANPGIAEFTFRSNGAQRGNWTYGYQDLEFDIALVKPADSSAIPASGLSPHPFPLSANNSLLSVSFDGAVSQGQGYVVSQDVEEPIRFANKTVLMKGLVKIAAIGGLGSISQPGDSGAALITSDNKAVAIILASSPLYTYAMSLEKIFAGWDASIH